MLKYITKNTSHTRYVSYGGEGGIPPPPAFETASGSRSSLRRSRPHSKYATGIFLGVGFESDPNAAIHKHLVCTRRFCMAEREGFEPSVRFPVHMISSQARSTTPAPLQGFSCSSLAVTLFHVNSRRRGQEDQYPEQHSQIIFKIWNINKPVNQYGDDNGESRNF